MAMNTGAILLPLLMVLAVSDCAPRRITFGGEVGVRNHFNATIGGGGEATIDGFSVSGGAEGIGSVDWKPELVGKAYGGIDDKIAGIDASLKGDIGGTLRPGFTGALGRDSKGKYKSKFVPYMPVDNTFVLKPNLDIVYGDEAKEVFGLGSASGKDKKIGAKKQSQVTQEQLAPEEFPEDEVTSDELTEEELAEEELVQQELARLRAQQRLLRARKQRAQKQRKNKSQKSEDERLKEQIYQLQEELAQSSGGQY